MPAQRRKGRFSARDRWKAPGMFRPFPHWLDIRSAAAVHLELGFDDAEFTGSAVRHQCVVHPKGMLLHSHLELLETIVRQAHRTAPAVKPRETAEIGQDGLISAAVAN